MRRGITINEKKMNDGGRERAPIEVKVFESCEDVIAQRVAVRWIELDLFVAFDWNPHLFHWLGQIDSGRRLAPVVVG